jgi:stage II sporulation protein P
MKKWLQKAVALVSSMLTVAAVACVALRMPVAASQNAAVAAAGFIMPGGAIRVMKDGFVEEDEEDDGIPSARSASSAVSSAPVFSLPPRSSEGGANASSAAAASGLPASKGGGITEMTVGNSGTQYQNIWVKNSNKNHGIDIAGELKKQPAIKIIKNASTPQVLIYHTHTTEAFRPNDSSPNDSSQYRSRDASRSVVAVGDRIAAQLEAAGIKTLHDTTLHDYPMYNGSYNRSKATMQKDLKKYPGIQVTLDIHRDAMEMKDNTRGKPTTVINGKKAAQIMVICGCDDDGTLGFPNWEYNLRFAVRLQKSLADRYPTLAKPLNFLPRKYNENMTKGSLLIEVGTEVNTVDEVKYSGDMLGKALAAVLDRLT